MCEPKPQFHGGMKHFSWPIRPIINTGVLRAMKNMEHEFYGGVSWCMLIHHHFHGKFMAHERDNFYFHESWKIYPLVSRKFHGPWNRQPLLSSPVAETGNSVFRSTHELEKVRHRILLEQCLLSKAWYVVKWKSSIQSGIITSAWLTDIMNIVKCEISILQHSVDHVYLIWNTPMHLKFYTLHCLEH